ncbi:MAG: hypothetical protein NVS1B4_23390 [Gemmatimonadaceae bacterium]
MRLMPACRRRLSPIALPLTLALTAIAHLAGAQRSASGSGGFDSSYFRGLEWRNIGPNRGGRSIAAAGSAARPLEYYFGAVGGGLWKTTDGGTSWRAVTDGKIRSSSVGAVAVAPSNPDVVYIGMGETEFRGNVMQGDGVYKSVDGGKTWTHMGLAETQAIARVRVDPTNPEIVFVAALGHPFGVNAERGIFRSRDGGKSWRRVLARGDSTGGVDLVIDAHDPRVVYAALWQAYRTPWTMSSGGAGSGLFKSSDGGESWTELTRAPGMPSGVIGKIGVAVSPADPRRVYAMVEADSGGVFRSDDAGSTWRRTNADRKLRQRAFYYSRLTADPQNRDRVYVLNVGLFRSDDGGVTFDTTIAVAHSDNHDLWIAPNDPRRMINANDGGGSVSVNGGTTWTAQRYPTAQSYHVATTTDIPYHVCGAQQDNSTFCVPSSGSRHLAPPGDAAGDWFYSVGGGESGYIAPDPAHPDVFYAGSQGALLTRYDRRTGQIRDVQVYPRFFSGEPSSALRERWQWTYPIVFAPRNPRVLYTSSQHLWRSSDEGQSWTRISPDLTRHDPATLGESGGPITHDMNGPEIYATIYTIAPSPRDSLTLWTGSDDGLVHVTRDGGRTWANVTPPALPPFSRVSLIEASPHRAGSAYLAAKRYQLDDRAPYLFKTSDYGRSWTAIVTGIPRDDYAHAIREDPIRAGLLFAGTEHGVWVSFDDGGQWQSLSRNLPDTQVPDLVVEDRDLVIATHGRSMYVLPDIAPLRQLTADVRGKPLHLVQPRDVVLNVHGATLQYWLGRAVDTVKVEVLDAKGALVRTIVGSAHDSVAKDSARKASTAADSCETRRRRADERLPGTAAGLNSYEWDLRYPGPTTFACMIIWGADPSVGPAAPPGRYQVRVTANGVTSTQPLVVRRDPRERVSDADLVAQFTLAIRIRDRVSEANAAVIRIRALRDEVRERLRAPVDATRRAALESSLPTLRALEEELYQTRNRSGQDPLNFPIRLNNRLAALERSVETGDARPTAAALVVLRELSAELDSVLRRLDAVAAAITPPPIS